MIRINGDIHVYLKMFVQYNVCDVSMKAKKSTEETLYIDVLITN